MSDPHHLDPRHQTETASNLVFGAGTRERITYLIANYDQARYLPECLESLHRQTSSRWLALIGDDGSTDDSIEVIQPFLDERIRLLVNGENIGYVATLERLIENARTDIVGILDPDDALFPEATRRVLGAYADDPTAAFVYTRFGIFDHRLRRCLGIGGHAIPPARTSLEAGGIGALRTFRRSAYRLTEGLDDSFAFAEDRDLVYKLEEVATPIFIDDVLYKYRKVPGSQSSDPCNRELGARHHRQAKVNALRRRRIGGARGVFYRMVFLGEYLEYSQHPPAWLRAAARVALRALRQVDRRLRIRTTRRCPRPDGSTKTRMARTT